MTTHIIHHNDPDGDCSAAIAKYSLPSDTEVVFHRVSYGDEFPKDINSRRDCVIIVDFSYQSQEKMEELAEKFGNRLTWIDHHQTSVDMCEASPLLRDVHGVRTLGATKDGDPLAACELSWTYFMGASPVPPIVKWIGDWDTWRHVKYGTTADVWAFNTAMFDARMFPADRMDWWEKRFYPLFPTQDHEDFIQNIMVPRGRPFVEFERKRNRGLLYHQGFEATLETDSVEYRVLCVNAQGGSLMFMDYLDNEKYDGMLKFFFTSLGYVTVGLYSEDHEVLNCAEVCKVLGQAGPRPSGGGHAGAAGFLCDYEYLTKILKNPVTLKSLSKK